MRTPCSLGAIAIAGLSMASPAMAQNAARVPIGHAAIDKAADAVEPQVIAWRRQIHQHPELAFQEVKTAALISGALKKMGYQVRTGVAGTGVVATLTGGRPGGGVALRADMDGLPVKEETGLPFASTDTGSWEGKTVPVMHACGHDAHVAVLLGTAKILADMKADLPGSVTLIFQPGEETGWGKDRDGAARMIAHGALKMAPVDAVFGLHAGSDLHVGEAATRPGPYQASYDTVNIVVQGRQTHGSAPWTGVDSVVGAAQVVTALQTVVSRQINATQFPLVFTIGSIHGGERAGIIPDSVSMEGAISTYDEGLRDQAFARIKSTAEAAAGTVGATAKVELVKGYPVNVNDPALYEWGKGPLGAVFGDGLKLADRRTGSEDFSWFGREVPSLFLHFGVTTPGADIATVARNHSPKFIVDETGLKYGVRALTTLAVDYLQQHPKPTAQ
nr:amidohydrolase [Sphingobium sp.]